MEKCSFCGRSKKEVNIFFWRIVQVFALSGLIIFFIPLLLSTIPFLIFLYAIIQPLNHANKKLKGNNIVETSTVKGGNGNGNITLH